MPCGGKKGKGKGKGKFYLSQKEKYKWKEFFAYLTLSCPSLDNVEVFDDVGEFSPAAKKFFTNYSTMNLIQKNLNKKSVFTYYWRNKEIDKEPMYGGEI